MSEELFTSSDELEFESNLELFDNDLSSGSVIRVLRPDSEVGIETLTDQYVKWLLKCQSYSFNIMLLGSTAIGKSTLIDSLFKTKFTDDSLRSHSLPEVEVVSNYYDLEENGVNLKLGVIESKGFGDQIIKDESYKPIVEYIDKQFDKHLAEELKVERNPQQMDTRVHVCLYLISPIGHGLKAIDLLTMKSLDSKVNLIPVIAKSDQITKPELTQIKAKIMTEIESNRINIYRFTDNDSSEESPIDSQIFSDLPFAVIASNEFDLIGDKMVRARQYPWGTVEVENKSHSDFPILRQMIMSNLNDLKDTTHCRHYEQYRSERLEELWKEKQLKHKNQLKAREKELIDNFTAKLRLKEHELRKSEKDLHLKFEQLSKERIQDQMRLDLDGQRLDEDIRTLNARKLLVFGQRSGRFESGDRKPNSNPKKKN